MCVFLLVCSWRFVLERGRYLATIWGRTCLLLISYLHTYAPTYYLFAYLLTYSHPLCSASSLASSIKRTIRSFIIFLTWFRLGHKHRMMGGLPGGINLWAQRKIKSPFWCAEGAPHLPRSGWSGSSGGLMLGLSSWMSNLSAVEKVVKLFFWFVAKHTLESWSENGSWPKKKPTLSKTSPRRTPSGSKDAFLMFAKFGFFLGRLPLGGDHFFTFL